MKQHIFNADYRRQQGLAHPAIIAWRLLWAPAVWAALGLLFVLIFIQQGPRIARDILKGIM